MDSRLPCRLCWGRDCGPVPDVQRPLLNAYVCLFVCRLAKGSPYPSPVRAPHPLLCLRRRLCPSGYLKVTILRRFQNYYYYNALTLCPKWLERAALLCVNNVEATILHLFQNYYHYKHIINQNRKALLLQTTRIFQF